jgi:hypothetical protein
MDNGQGMALPGAERERSLMKAERWKQINDLFQSAVERAPGERAAFLDEACNSDEELRREVESLLSSHERATNFIELPAFEVAPELVTNDRAGALIGKVIGHYRIESLIGVGGMGDAVPVETTWITTQAIQSLIPLMAEYGIDGGSFWRWTSFQNSEDQDPTLAQPIKLRGVEFNYTAAKTVLECYYTGACRLPPAIRSKPTPHPRPTPPRGELPLPHPRS